LLRAQVGDDNRAIEDFNFVIEMEPDNMMAIFNRGTLLDQTGDYKGAIRDYTTVINEYPNFWTGYHYRAEARRKIGDKKGADADDFTVLKAQIDRQNGKTTAKQNNNQKEEEETADNGSDKTRKKSDKNMNNYRKIVVADDANEDERYQNAYRGKVQNRQVKVELQPLYALTYYEKRSEVRRTINYYRTIDELGQNPLLHQRLLITNMESPLTEEQAARHFSSIDAYTLQITQHPDESLPYFLRGLDFYLTQDFNSAVDDFTQSILKDGNFMPAYFNRALVRYKQLEYRKSELRASREAGNLIAPNEEIRAVDYEIVKNDLNKVIELAPDFAFAYYNRGNLYSQLTDYRAAIADYTTAISLNATFAEAYFNRGLTYIFLGNNQQGVADLSKAGELGIFEAYNVIKRYTVTK
jgi:tetratricopeptide (TPR) repeat protein